MVLPFQWHWSNVQYQYSIKINLTRDTNQHIHKVTISNGMFNFKGNILSRLPKPVELSHKWVLTNFKYQEEEFHDILFDEYQ